MTDAALCTSAFDHRSDPLALALACQACFLTARAAKDSDMGRSLILAGLFTALAVWTKQTFLPLFLGLGLYLAAASGKGSALRYFASFLGFAAVFCVLFSFLFGFQAMWLNMIVIPARHPWYLRIGARTDLITGPAILSRILVTGSAALELVDYGALPIGAAAFLYFLLRRQAAKDKSVFLLFLIASVCLWPTAILGRVKAGGTPHDYMPPLYFLLLALIAAYRSLPRGEPPARLVKALLSISLLLLSAKTLLLFSRHNLRDRCSASPPHEVAYRDILRRGGTHFPDFVLSGLLADGNLYHSACGLTSYASAGYPVDPDYYRRFFPKGVKQIAYFNDGGTCADHTGMDPFLASFSKQASDPALPGWIVCGLP